jgi:5-methylcytosine-specific restriction endonuclease McrA
MIKLQRLPAPPYLTAERVEELTEDFRQRKSNVWAHDAIKKQLLASSNSKCAYCESRLDEESKYMEVEHFEDKDSYPENVVMWENLLPSCKRCNVAKGSHDVRSEPIIDPYKQQPNTHLYLKAFRFRSKCQLGRSTVDVLDLNNSARVVLKRFEIGEAVIAAIEVAVDRYERWVTSKSTRSRNVLLGCVEGLLLQCQPESEYSATAATVLHDNSEYLELIGNMRHGGLWTPELEALNSSSRKLVLLQS